jgi:PAS domain S-box-containing protein
VRHGSGPRRQDRGTPRQPEQEAPTRQIPATAHLKSVLGNLFALSPDAIFFTDSEGVIRDANPRSEELFGYTSPELFAKSIDCLVPERFRRNHPRHRKDFIANSTIRQMGASLSIFGLRKHGTEFPVVLLSSADDEDTAALAVPEGAQDYLIKGQIEPRSLIRALLNSAARKTFDEALFLEKERAQVTLDCIGYAVICTDTSGNITFLNPAAERMTGWPLKDAAGRPMSETFRILDAITRKSILDPMAKATSQNRVGKLPSNLNCTLEARIRDGLTKA